VLQAISFGQIYMVFKLLGISIQIPKFLVNFTMTWRGDETWERQSSLFFGLITVTGGNYNFRRVIDGNGKPGYWYNRGWLTYRNRTDVAIGYKVFPRT